MPSQDFWPTTNLPWSPEHASRSMTQYPTCSQLFSALQKKKTSHLHLHSAILDHFHIWRHQLNHATPATKNGPPKNTARQAVRLAALSPLRVMLGPSGGLGAWMPWCHGQVIWRYSPSEGLAVSKTSESKHQLNRILCGKPSKKPPIMDG